VRLRGTLDLNPRLGHVENVKFLGFGERGEDVLFESKLFISSFNVEFTVRDETL